MARFFSQVRARPVDANGNPYAGAKLYFYIAGTTTPQNVYSDSTLVTPLSNPVVADGNGQFVQIYTQAANYRVDFKTSADVLLASDDNVDFGQPLSTGVLSVLLGGTGASTASGARSNLGLGTAAIKDVSTSAQFLANSADNLPGNNAIWTSAAPVTVAYAASVALDFNTFVNMKMTLTGNLSLTAPTNMKAGQSGVLSFTQDGTGSRTITWNGAYVFPGGSDFVASLTAGAIDHCAYYCPTNALVVISGLASVA